MSSTSKTGYLNLNQWAASDGVCREDFNADNLAVDAAVGAIPLRKLKKITTSAAAASVEIDLSDIAMGDFAEIWMDIRLGMSCDAGDSVFMRLNNISAESYNDAYVSSTQLWCNPNASAMKLYIGLHKFALGEKICCFKPAYPSYGDISAAVLPPESWTGITFFSSTNGDSIPAGGTVTIYGVKKL